MTNHKSQKEICSLKSTRYTTGKLVRVQGKGSHKPNRLQSIHAQRTGKPTKGPGRNANHSAKYKDATLAFKPNCQRTNRPVDWGNRPGGNSAKKPTAAQRAAHPNGQGAKRSHFDRLAPRSLWLSTYPSGVPVRFGADTQPNRYPGHHSQRLSVNRCRGVTLDKQVNISVPNLGVKGGFANFMENLPGKNRGSIRAATIRQTGGVRGLLKKSASGAKNRRVA